MALTSGTKLGPYEIQSALGAGGMGEVYRARDTRLDRDVAIKILPESFAADQERLRRFEQEARSIAALSHPNILAVFDIGQHAGTRYLVSELLQGETLRSKLQAGPISVRRATEYGLQIAQGLSAAHERGVVHRDLKPENIFVVHDGRVKILDFGLAKQAALAAAAAGQEPGATMGTVGEQITTPGLVVGTVGYMAPEQVRGEPADHRADIFAFGAVLYEMLAGQRAFKRDSAVETMTAILKEDPPEMTQGGRQIPPAVDRIVRRCLEKGPSLRFQSAKDLAFALDNTAVTSGTTAVGEAATRRRIALPLPTAAIIVLVALAVALVGIYSSRRSSRSTAPVFHQLNYTRGYVRTARFAPDGETVVFGGMWNGDPMKLWFQRTDSNEFSPLPVPEADLLSVSSTGELAIALKRGFPQMNVTKGTLARVPLTGGAPRELMDDVLDADWAPDGSSLAITRRVGDRFRLEFPIGKVLYENSGYISHIRFSHRGDRIAFMDHPYFGDDRGFVCVVDLAGNKRVLTQEWNGQQGLAWSPGDDEIWFAASPDTGNNLLILMAVTLSGHQRVVLRTPARLVLQDISRDGRVLLSGESERIDVMLGETSSLKERDFTWFNQSWYHKLSDDGQWMVFSTSVGGGANYSVFARKTDGSPAVRLGDGNALAFSADGKWVAAMLPAADNTLSLIPLGVGETKVLKADGLHYRSAFWLPDGQRLLTVAFESGHGARTYLESTSGSGRRALTPEGIEAQVLSPDGRRFIARSEKGKYLLFDVDGGAPRELTGLATDDQIIQWLRGSNTLIVSALFDIGVTAYQFDIETGRKKSWNRFVPTDKVGLIGIESFYVTPDAARYILADVHTLSSLFVADGLK